MKDLSQLTCCVVDHGLFLPIGQKLAESYKTVFYWSPWEEVIPKIEKGIVGDGFENLVRVPDIWSVKQDCDLFVFPDVGFGGLQKELTNQGFPVWGHHGGDELETNRGLFIKTIEQLEMDVPKFKVIKGMTKLRAHLKDESDKWIKVSKWRGNWETFHWRSWEEDESTLDCYSYKLGPTKELFNFYVFDTIDSDVEDGIDSYCIDGKFPKTVIHGLECKDKSYLCAVQPMEEISEKVRIANEMFAPILGGYGYRGAFSTEVRIAGDKSYFIDPTCRFGSPPSQVMTEIVDNFAEVIAAGAEGELVEPECSKQFGVQASITCDRESDEWTALRIPKEIRQWCKMGFACEIGGTLWEPPHDLKNMIGWLVAVGKTPSDAIENLKEYRSELPDGISCDVESLASLLAETEKAAEEGIVYPGEMPEPSEVLE